MPYKIGFFISICLVAAGSSEPLPFLWVLEIRPCLQYILFRHLSFPCAQILDQTCMPEKWPRVIWPQILVIPGLDFMKNAILDFLACVPYITFIQNCEIYYKNSSKSLTNLTSYLLQTHHIHPKVQNFDVLGPYFMFMTRSNHPINHVSMFIIQYGLLVKYLDSYSKFPNFE